MPAPSGKESLRRPRIAGTLWLLAWMAMAAWASHRLATSWPYVMLMPQWLLVLAVPGILFRAFELAWMQARRRRLPGGWRRFAIRAVSVVAGLFAAAGLWRAMENISQARFERALAPLVAQVHANVEAPCPPQAQYAIDPALAAYLEDAGAPRAAAELHHDRRRFVLALGGYSMDIDGSTLFYDSRTRAWRKTHNDELGRTGELAALREGLDACRVPLRA